MTVWAVASVRGAPGATALAMALGATWPATAERSVAVVEADPDGGVLAARFEELRADRTLADVAVALRRDGDVAHQAAGARAVWGGLRVIPAHPSGDQVTSLLTTTGERLAVALASAADVDAIVDVGRLSDRSPALPLARRAVVTLVVTRPRFEDVAAVAARARELRAAGVELGLVVVGSRPYPAADVAAEVEVPLLAALPHDPRSAAVLTGEGTADVRLRRSLLWRAVGELASRLQARAAPRLAPTDVPASAMGAPGEVGEW